MVILLLPLIQEGVLMDFDKYLMVLQTIIDYSSDNTDFMLYDRKYSLLTVKTGHRTVEYGRKKLTYKNGSTVFLTAHRTLYMCIKVL